MLSIFILYSPDRKKQLETTVSCLEDMEGYKDCQKILCIDGDDNTLNLPDFDLVKVKRRNKYFNWSVAWNAGINASKFDKILYLDSDRILPKNYLTLLNDMVGDGVFVYSKTLVHLNDHYYTDFVKDIRDRPYAYNKYWRHDPRMPHPPNSSVLMIGRNPMSGNTAFTKHTWEITGGVDNTFEGWGWPDTEYYIRSWKMGMKFSTIDCVELHLHHEYAIKNDRFKLMHIWNACKLADKFKLELNDDYRNRMQMLGLTRAYLERFNNLESFVDYMENKNKIKYM